MSVAIVLVLTVPVTGWMAALLSFLVVVSCISVVVRSLESHEDELQHKQVQ